MKDDNKKLLSQVLLHLWSHQGAQALLIVCLTTAIAAFLPYGSWRWSRALDNSAMDAAFRFRGAQSPHAVAEQLPATRDIVIIETHHMLPRPLLARLLSKLVLAKVIACDMMLEDHEGELTPDEKPWYASNIKIWQRENVALAQQLHRLPTVVLGTWIEAGKVTASPGVQNRPKQWLWQSPPTDIWQSAGYHAHFVINPDEQDGVVREVPLLLSATNSTSNGNAGQQPCLGLALAAAAQGIRPSQLTKCTIRDGYLQLGGRRIPVDSSGNMIINYVGGRACFDDDRNRINYLSVLDGYEPEDFKDKIVLIGETSSRSKEVMPTPFGPMPAVAIHANVVATLLSSDGPPVRLSHWQVSLIAFACSLFLAIPMVRLSWWGSLVVAGVQAALLLWMGAWLFLAHHLILPISVPLTAIVLTYNAVALYESKATRLILTRFLGRETVPIALHSNSRLLSARSLAEATALFCDLHGFSNLTEAMPLEKVAQFSSEYMEVAARIIYYYQGRIIDYNGDGIFALFEPSSNDRAHSLRAAQAALELDAGIRQLGMRWWPDHPLPLQAGFGLETGPVMVGLIGGKQRLKLGAVGKAVNVACHVQACTRGSGYSILVTQDTYERIKQQIPACYYDTRKLKGRQQATALYGLVST